MKATEMGLTDVVRACFASYLTQDRAAAERLIADNYVFTSPQDDHIDRAAFFDRCFPTAERLRSQELLDVIAISPDEVFVRYEHELADGSRYRNVEVSTVQDGRLIETQVYFGGSFPAS